MKTRQDKIERVVQKYEKARNNGSVQAMKNAFMRFKSMNVPTETIAEYLNQARIDHQITVSTVKLNVDQDQIEEPMFGDKHHLIYRVEKNTKGQDRARAHCPKAIHIGSESKVEFVDKVIPKIIDKYKDRSTKGKITDPDEQCIVNGIRTECSRSSFSSVGNFKAVFYLNDAAHHLRSTYFSTNSDREFTPFGKEIFKLCVRIFNSSKSWELEMDAAAAILIAIDGAMEGDEIKVARAVVASDQLYNSSLPQGPF